MASLANMKCTPCRGEDPPLTTTEIADLHSQLPDWKILERNGINQLEREFRVKNFAEALSFSNRVGEIAGAEDHHPAILTEWGKATVSWWTHKIKGLHRNDFVMADKTNRLQA